MQSKARIKGEQQQFYQKFVTFEPWEFLYLKTAIIANNFHTSYSRIENLQIKYVWMCSAFFFCYQNTDSWHQIYEIDGNP